MAFREIEESVRRMLTRLGVLERTTSRRMASTAYAMSAGVVAITSTSGSTTSATVTFPAGRFSSPPVATVSPNSTLPDIRRVSYGSVTATGMTVYFHNASASAGSSVTLNVSWTATQMTPTSGAG